MIIAVPVEAGSSAIMVPDMPAVTMAGLLDIAEYVSRSSSGSRKYGAMSTLSAVPSSVSVWAGMVPTARGARFAGCVIVISCAWIADGVSVGPATDEPPPPPHAANPAAIPRTRHVFAGKRPACVMTSSDSRAARMPPESRVRPPGSGFPPGMRSATTLSMPFRSQRLGESSSPRELLRA